MRINAVLVSVCGAVVALSLSLLGPASSQNAQNAPPALSGLVSSAEEGPMEGVLVSAQRADSTITITVVSGADGRFSFPADKIPAGG